MKNFDKKPTKQTTVEIIILEPETVSLLHLGWLDEYEISSPSSTLGKKPSGSSARLIYVFKLSAK